MFPGVTKGHRNANLHHISSYTHAVNDIVHTSKMVDLLSIRMMNHDTPASSHDDLESSAGVSCCVPTDPMSKPARNIPMYGADSYGFGPPAGRGKGDRARTLGQKDHDATRVVNW